ncbi:monooxygenase [Xylariaceae sp. FL0804]|nr:monooxygenase [Xylariaceae sp. FL0804]
MPLKILVIGAGVCGPALALLLGRSSKQQYDITVVERAAELRQNGLQIDLRAQGITVVKRLGLEATVRARVADEAGFALVDQQGRACARFGKNESGKGQQAFSSEFEIMRGDLVDILYKTSLEEADARGGGGGERGRADESGRGSEKDKVDGEVPGRVDSASGLRYEFNVSVTDMTEDERGVAVTFSDGRRDRYDAVVGADGQNSRTRRTLLGQDASDAAFRSLELLIAYYTIPHLEGEDAYAKWYQVHGRRLVMLRTNTDKSQVILCAMRPVDEIRDVLARPVAGQKDAFARLFEDAGWRAGECVEKMMETEDFYAQEMVQIKTDTIAQGRIALLGDAGYCPSPLSGMGTTLSLVGAYVLAGELGRHGDDVPSAMAAYEKTLRPFIDAAQHLPPGVPKLVYLESKWGVWILNTIISWAAWLKLDVLVNRLMPEDKGGLPLPEYPELKL